MAKKKYCCAIEEQLDDERNLRKIPRKKLGSPTIKNLPQTIGFNKLPRQLSCLSQTYLGQQGLKKLHTTSRNLLETNKNMSGTTHGMVSGNHFSLVLIAVLKNCNHIRK
jgi:hypothetical protein